jgi:hypothetical protein
MDRGRGLCHDHTTNRRMLLWLVAPEGESRVPIRAKYRRGLVPLAAALVLATGLCSCGSDFDTSAAWFAKPLTVYSSRSGYTYAQLDEAKRDRPIAANDLIDANGACPRFVMQAPAPSASSGPDAAATASADASNFLNAGVAIGMSECDVVARLGAPTAVNIGRTPGGDRAVTLTFNGGPRPGLYRFAGGRLSEMDRVEVPAPPPTEPAKKKIVKKKPDKTKEPAKPDDKT